MDKGLVIVGAGGHAKVCIELFRAMGENVDFCVDANPANPHCLGVPVLRGDDHLESLRREGYGRAFVALGANGLRMRLGERLRSLGYQLVNAISPNAIISPTAKLGSGIAVMAGVVINAESIVDDFSIINTGATIDHDCRICKAVHIAPQCALAGNVHVGELAFLGIGTKVIPAQSIGQGAIVGAGSVILRGVASESTVVGIPARVIKQKH